MIDLFFCTLSYSRMGLKHGHLREKMADLCLEAWKQVPEVSVHVLYGEDKAFQKKRREIADKTARSSLYACVDDDILPTKVDVGKIANLFSQYPDFVMLSALPINCRIYPWNDGISNADIMEHVSVGGCRFMLKGCMAEWPEMNGAGYDLIQAEQLRSQGKKVGYSLATECIHLGEGKSVTW